MTMHRVAHHALQSSLRLAVVTLMMAQTLPAQTPPANQVPCAAYDADLVKVPEIGRSIGFLRGTIYATSERVRMTTRNGRALGTVPPVCAGQVVRAYRIDAPVPVPPTSELLDPMPGPTLRARVGDLVELTFINQIDPNRFARSSDSDCDRTSTYPGAKDASDKSPDCFKGSTITNMHFHGTHTNPNSTGDNVFLMIHPSPRSKDAARTPLVTKEMVEKPIADFFERCEEKLKPNNSPILWPRVWADLPQSWQDKQRDLLMQYAPDLWAENDKLIKEGKWPQNYLGAYAYCYRLPDYTSDTWPPAPPQVETSAHSAGVGSAQHDESMQPSRPLMMGQTPGTHWYHAHKHGSTTINVLNGMTGVFIIEGQYDDEINQAYRAYGENWTSKQPVLVVNQLGSVPNLVVNGAGGGKGPDFSVNGRIRPKIRMKAGEVQMWRIANTSSRGGIYFLSPSVLKWRQIAQDGVQYSDVNYQKSKDNPNQPFLLAAGNRADMLVKAPALKAGGDANNTYAVLVNNSVDPSDRQAGAAQLTLLSVVVDGTGPDMPFLEKAPSFPKYLKDIADDEVKGTKTLVFASSALPPAGTPIADAPSHHTIDGKKFDGEVGVSVMLNRAEEWKVVNETYAGNQIAHPFHIHINPFQIVELFDPNAKLATLPGTGSVATTAASAVVTGTGTTFTTQLRIGDTVTIAGEAAATVKSIASDTSMTLSANAKTTGTGRAYTTAAPRYVFYNSEIRTGQCYIDPQDTKAWKPCGPTVPATDHIWWDVFSIPSGALAVDAKGNAINDAGNNQIKVPGYFKMRSRFVDYSGYYVLHCHILAHEDRGMMTVVEVTPLQSPYSHH